MKKIFIFLALVSVVTLSANAQRNRDRNAQQQAQTIEPETPVFVPTHEGPHIQFEKTVHDYGQILQGASGYSEFKFRNMGSEPLVLTNVQTGCGCAAPSWPREPIMPGEEAMITIRYDTNRIGTIGRIITVLSNSVGEESERVTLRLSGRVNPQT